jgi:hypothetical protein
MVKRLINVSTRPDRSTALSRAAVVKIDGTAMKYRYTLDFPRKALVINLFAHE